MSAPLTHTILLKNGLLLMKEKLQALISQISLEYLCLYSNGQRIYSHAEHDKQSLGQACTSSLFSSFFFDVASNVNLIVSAAAFVLK